MPQTQGDEGARNVTDREWLFDFLLSVFKSPSWDLAVMGFIDENCAVFDKEEENKLSYTTLHHQFKELVETLCANSLAEVGVAVGDFVEALEASRLSQDISKEVYQQLVALDDFVTFKKLMVKRNVELELEAVHALQEQGVPIRHGNEDGDVSSDEGTAGHDEEESRGATPSGESKRDKPASRPGRGRAALDRQLRRAMDANLQELELMHKREEVEQAELEQAIAMSLALEAKRIEYSTLPEGGRGHNTKTHGRRDAGGEGSMDGSSSAETGCKGADADDAGGASSGNRSDNELARRRQSKHQDAAIEEEATIRAADAPAEAKCDFSGGEAAGPAEEKLQPLLSSDYPTKGAGSKALPPLSKARVPGNIVAPFRGGSGEGLESGVLGGSGIIGSNMIRDPDVESSERRREARAASEKVKKLLDERRQAQKALKAQSEVSEEESAQRERHLKDMRDRIVSAKRAGREEQASKAASKLSATAGVASGADGGRAARHPHNSGNAAATGVTRSSGRRSTRDEKGGDDDCGDVEIVVHGEEVEEDFAETQRRMMRVALARHMKRELIEGEQDRLTKVQAEQLADLNGKLRLVEQLRNENAEREGEIAAALRQQQRQRARNVATSAATTQGGEDDFTFGETN